MSSEPPSQEVKDFEPETEIILSQPKKLPVPIVIESRSGEESQESDEVVLIEKSENPSTEDSFKSAQDDDDHSLTSGSLRLVAKNVIFKFYFIYMYKSFLKPRAHGRFN